MSIQNKSRIDQFFTGQPVNYKFFQRIFFCLITIFFVSQAELQIITSIPDIADIVKEIGKEKVSVFSLAEGTEDYHNIRAKSSFLPRINRADLVICLGLEAEIRWLGPLVDAGRNEHVRQGKPGWIEVYKGIEILEKPDNPELVTQIGGHKFGNPHINSGPYCGTFMAHNIVNALKAFDQQNSEYYQKNYDAYVILLERMEQDLKKKAVPLAGIHVISYHADLAYFCKFYGMSITGCLEPQPGIPPHSKHIAQLIENAKQQQVKLVLFHQAQNPQLPEKVAQRIGCSTVCFANMVGSRKEIHSFIELQHYNLDLMLEALKKKGS